MTEEKHSRHLLQDVGEEFCRETTLGGFNYLLNDHGPLPRRIIWGIVLAAFTSITVYQLSTQISSYISNPLSVSVSTVFPPKVQFPAVAVCNSMPYRISAVRPMSIMHDALNAMYRTPNLNHSAAARYMPVLERVTNVSAYLRHAASQKEDLIQSCNFTGDLGELCNVQQHFAARVTPLGICYEFGGELTRNNSLHVSHSHQSLELVINAETYEAMNGPYTSFGVNVLIYPYGTARYSKHVTPLINTHTNIILSHQVTTLVPGYTCDTKQLKYFSTYTRLRCQLEYEYDLVIEKCRCIPFEINPKFWPTNLNLLPCNLGQYFTCSLTIIGHQPNVEEAVCPKECVEYNLQPLVYQGDVAWERIESVADFNHAHYSKKLMTALEINQRYAPKKNRSTSHLLAMMLNATDAVEELFINVNTKLGCKYPDFPNTPTDHGFFGSKTASKINDNMNSIKLRIESFFLDLNESISVLGYFATNKTVLTLLKLDDVSYELEDHLLSEFEDLLSISDGRVYISYIKRFVEILTEFVFGSNRPSSLSGSMLDYLTTMNSSLYTSQGNTILLDSEMKLISEIDFDLKQLQLKSDSSCWNYQSLTTTNHSLLDMENEVQTNSAIPIFDVIMCLMIQHADDRLLNLVAFQLTKVGHIFKKTDLSGSDLKIRCLKVNRLLATNSATDPQLEKIEKWQQHLNVSLNLLKNMYEGCWKTKTSIQLKIDQFANGVTSKVDEYVKQTDTLTSFLKTMANIKTTLRSEIWKNSTNYPNISDNITKYLEVNITYKQLSEFVSDILAPHTYKDFTTNTNDVIATLEDVKKQLKTANELLEKIASREEKVGLNDTQNSMMIILAIYYLKETNVSEIENNFNRFQECNQQVSSKIEEVLSSISPTSKSFVANVKTWEIEAAKYLKSLQIDDAFLRTNFLVLRISYDEIKETMITQQLAYDFWTLMSDIGGASGLWLGFSCIFLVQCVDLVLRRCIIQPLQLITQKRNHLDQAHNLSVL